MACLLRTANLGRSGIAQGWLEASKLKQTLEGERDHIQAMSVLPWCAGQAMVGGLGKNQAGAKLQECLVGVCRRSQIAKPWVPRAFPTSGPNPWSWLGNQSAF